MPSRLRPVMLALAGLAVVPLVLAGQARIDPPGTRQPRAPSAPRIAPLPESEWGAAEKQLVAKLAPKGAPDNGMKTMLRLPVLLEGVAPYTNYLNDESTLTPRHRSLLSVRAVWLGGNPALWSVQAPRARSAGLTNADLRRIAEGPDAPGWDPFDRTLLQLADQLLRNSSVTDATWKQLSGSYDMLHLMDAVETVNHFIVLSMLYNSFGVQPDAGAADRPPSDVAYRITVPAREPALTVARVEPNPGTGIAVSRTLARHPEMNARRTRRANFINSVSKLTPRHREMFILRIGWNCQSEYEWAQHVGTVGRARDHGLDPKLIAQGADVAGWDPFERVILRSVDELYRDLMISDATWKALAERYDPSLLMSAVFTASSYRATSMVLNTLGVQLAPGDERFPTVGP